MEWNGRNVYFSMNCLTYKRTLTVIDLDFLFCFLFFTLGLGREAVHVKRKLQALNTI